VFINNNRGKERALKQIDFKDKIFQIMKKYLSRVSEPHHMMSDATKQIKNKWHLMCLGFATQLKEKRL